MNHAQAVEGFREAFQSDPLVVTRAPGRVNLIGEHTDYNDGFVMPAAIEFAIWTSIRPRADRVIRAMAGNKGDRLEFSLDDPGPPLQRHWSDYVRGVAVELGRGGFNLCGADIWFAGNVPDGAGLSSSAALEMSVGLALLTASNQPIDRIRLALAGQRAEHHFAGTKCGIMDQFISAHGEAGHALQLDCRSLTYELAPLPPGLSLVICDSGVKHELASGEYNIRRTQCEEGVERLRAALPGIRALRDVTPEQFETLAASLPEVIARRCRHVIHENERVHRFARALARNDRTALGTLMADSHRSLRDDYEVSCAELDALVEAAHHAPGLVGARMTGGGFGGCTINLVDTSRREDFQAAVSADYQRRTGIQPRVFTSQAAAGASLVNN